METKELAKAIMALVQPQKELNKKIDDLTRILKEINETNKDLRTAIRGLTTGIENAKGNNV